MTFFSPSNSDSLFLLIIVIIMIFFSYYLLNNYAVAPLPLSHGAPEFTSERIQVEKVRGGGVSLRCIPPYFDHCLPHRQTAFDWLYY